MRAIVMNRYGGPEVLEEADLPRPEPLPGEVLLRVRAAAVNPADGKWRAGMFADFAPVPFPHILGYDVAGEIVAGQSGESESGDGFAAGTRVFGMLDPFRKGGYAEYVAVAADRLAIMPDALAFDTAAAIPTAGLTGTQMAGALPILAGGHVLITGAAGAVGRFALHAAKARGAHVVAAVRAAQRDDALALGADGLILLGEEDWAGAPFDHVIDTVGGAAVGRLCLHLKPGGRILTAATTPVAADGLTATPEVFTVQADAAMLSRLAEAVVAGDVPVPVAHVLPLSAAAAAEAQRRVDGGGTGGKIILAP